MKLFLSAFTLTIISSGCFHVGYLVLAVSLPKKNLLILKYSIKAETKLLAAGDRFPLLPPVVFLLIKINSLEQEGSLQSFTQQVSGGA